MPRMRMRPTGVLAAVVGAAAHGAGCGVDRADPAEAFSVRDSASVRIAESRAPVWKETGVWRVLAEPTVAIGVAGGRPEYQLQGVTDALRLEDGRIVVADGGSAEIRFYAPDGSFRRALGRPGEGPGEFRDLQRLERYGRDSLIAFDAALARLSVLGPEGAFARSLALPTRGEYSVRFLGAFDDRTLLACEREGYSSGDPSGLQRPELPYFRYGPDGSLLDTIGRFPDSEVFFYSEGTAFGYTELPYGRRTSTVVAGDRFHVATGDSYEVSVHAADGGLLGIIRREWALRPLTDADVDADRRRRLDDLRQIGDTAFRRWAGRLTEALPYPAVVAPYTGILVDVEGNLWVEEQAGPEAGAAVLAEPGAAEALPSQWAVFDDEGRWLGSLAMPRSLIVHEIGEDHVLARWNDELGVERVGLYALEKP